MARGGRRVTVGRRRPTSSACCCSGPTCTPTAWPSETRSGRSVTYGDLGLGVRAVASHLERAGLEPGAGVLLAVRPSPRAVMAALGVVLARAVVVVADPGAGEALVDVRRRTVPVRAAVADTLVHAATRRPLSSLLARLPATAGLQLPDLSTPGLVHLVTGPRLPGVPRSATRWEAPAPGEVDPRRRATPPVTPSSSSPPARPPRHEPSCTPSRRSRRGCTPPSPRSTSTSTSSCTPTS